MMLAREDFVAGPHDQAAPFVVKPLVVVICRRRGLLQCGVGSDHFARNQILADAEMLEGTLGLRTPQFVRWNLNRAETVGFFSRLLLRKCHVSRNPPCAARQTR